MAKKQVSKLSKKALKKQNSRQRNLWPVNPVTKVVPSGKLYSRRRLKGVYAED